MRGMTRREFRGVDLADHVRELRTRGEALGVPLIPMPPRDAHLALGGAAEVLSRRARNRVERVFVDRRSGQVEVRDVLVEKAHE
jgi:hypothetical protein